MSHETGSSPASMNVETYKTQRIVVAIPTLNEERNIETVLKTLAQEKTHLPNLHIVVVDGDSKDRTIELANKVSRMFPFIEVINNPLRLQSAAINLVAQQWKGEADILVRCDAHAYYPTGFVRSLVDSLSKTGADSVVVPMDSIGRDCMEKAVAWVSDTPFGSGGSAHRGGMKSGFVDHGHHAAFKLSSFLDNGGYDESFSHNEDAEFDCRLGSRGGRVFLDASTRITYHPRNTLSRLWRQYFNYGKGRSRTVRRHPHSLRVRQVVVPLHFLLTVFSILLAIVAGSWFFLVWPMLYAAALAAVSVVLVVNHKSACALFAGPAAAVMHFSWASGFFWGLIRVRERRWKP